MPSIYHFAQATPKPRESISALPDGSRYAIVHSHSLTGNAINARKSINTSLFVRNYGRRELLNLADDTSQPAETRKAELVEGIERGSDLSEMFNAEALYSRATLRQNY